eukprot:scaffold779_cov48-Phaeocystis_antarctica.AAC.1
MGPVAARCARAGEGAWSRLAPLITSARPHHGGRRSCPALSWCRHSSHSGRCGCDWHWTWTCWTWTW